MKPSLHIKPIYYTIHNDTRIDPYPIKNYTSEIKQHIKKEHHYTAQRMKPYHSLQERIEKEIKHHEPLQHVSVPIQGGNWWYCTRTDAHHNYPVHIRFPITSDTIPSRIPDDAVVYFDENVKAEDYECYSVSFVKPNPNHTWFVVGVDTIGTERYRIAFHSFSTDHYSDPVPLKTDSFEAEEVEWMNDSRHIIYSQLDEKNRPYQVWRHRLGTSHKDDELLYEEPDELFAVTISRSRNHHILLIHSNSSNSTKVYATSLHTPSGIECLHSLHTGISCTWNQYTLDDDTYWLQVTNRGAIAFQCLVAEVSDHEEHMENIKKLKKLQWYRLLPASMQRLVRVEVFDNMVVWEERYHGNASVRYAAWQSLPDSHVLHDHVSSIILSSDELSFYSPFFRIHVTSLREPEKIMDIYLDKKSKNKMNKTTMTKKHIKVHSSEQLRFYDKTKYETKRTMMESYDGTAIPVSIVYKKPLQFPCPIVLYAYGSYETCSDQDFSISRLSLLDRGVMYVIAHVRGGGECGRTWYDHGRLRHKENSFHDVISVATYMIENGWTTPEQLIMRGGSAGGMLMATVMNRAPHLCKAVVAEVPFVDVVTTLLDETLPLSIGEREEWGNPHDPHVYHRIKRYSPYDNIKAMKYPNVYVTGALHDTRVLFCEPLKWALRLRDAHPDNNVYLYMEDSGHTGATSKEEQYQDESAIITFILSELGIEK